MNELAEWDSFYLIVGGAAGALIGLQFVAMTLIASRPNAASSADAGAAFATPTIVHFVEAFLIAAFVRMPWRNESSAAAMCGIVGVIGAVYTVIVARRMVIQTSYEPVFEDWLFHAILPLIAYMIIVISAIEVSSYERGSLFGVGAATLLLLLTGIHNSWDAVTWNIFADTGKSDGTPERKETDDREPEPA
ncbi:MAG: hypothetical protein ABI791_12510 [Acidobacteriota bacterium]